MLTSFGSGPKPSRALRVARNKLYHCLILLAHGHAPRSSRKEVPLLPRGTAAAAGCYPTPSSFTLFSHYSHSHTNTRSLPGLIVVNGKTGGAFAHKTGTCSMTRVGRKENLFPPNSEVSRNVRGDQIICSLGVVLF
jgi:hypothetical protein